MNDVAKRRDANEIEVIEEAATNPASTNGVNSGVTRRVGNQQMATLISGRPLLPSGESDRYIITNREIIIHDLRSC